MEKFLNSLLNAGESVFVITIAAIICLIVFHFYWLYLKFKFVESTVEKNKMQMQLMKMQIADLEYKRTRHYNKTELFMENQNELVYEQLENLRSNSKIEQ